VLSQERDIEKEIDEKVCRCYERKKLQKTANIVILNISKRTTINKKSLSLSLFTTWS